MERTNRDRAKSGRFAFAAFTADTYGRRTPEELGAPAVDDAIKAGSPDVDNDDDIMVAVGDLLGDLMHYCAAVGLDFDGQLDNGRRHFEAERSEAGWDGDVPAESESAAA